MKKILIFALSLLLCLLFAFPAFANEDEKARVVDKAELLTESQESKLSSKLDTISEKYKLDVVIVTSDHLGGKSAERYADDYFDYNGYGYGESHDGVLLLVSTEDDKWHISTCGYGITVFTDAGIDYIGDKIVPYFSDGEFADGFFEFAELCESFIIQAESGEPYDSHNLPHEPLSLVFIPISLVLGLVLAFIIVGSMKRKLKSVRYQPRADSYVKKGSMNITEKRDIFLFFNISRREKPQSSSGGSSTHRSSSGRSHGGGGGRF